MKRRQAAFLMQRKVDNNMECKHERIKSVNCRIFCDICGAELPADWLTGKNTPVQDNAAEPAEKPVKKAATRKKVK